MARPTDKPRLAALSPDALAAEADQRILRHLGKLHIPLSPGIFFDVRHHGQSGIALTIAALTEYAQRGLPVWDWETHGEARDAIQETLGVLYGSPGHPVGVGPLDGELEDADLDDPLDLVLVAAWARVTLADGDGLTARQLGALAGLDANVVRRFAREGELVLEGERPAKTTAEEARRWLRARGVRGL
jgi:hypothetical protein